MLLVHIHIKEIYFSNKENNICGRRNKFMPETKGIPKANNQQIKWYGWLRPLSNARQSKECKIDCSVGPER